MTGFRLEELQIPATLTGPGAADFIACANIRNQVEAVVYGTTELGYTADETLPAYLNLTHRPRRLVAARCEGAVVGRAMFLHLADDPEVAWADVQVLPAFRRRGIGSALIDRMERLTRDAGRRRLIVYAPSADGPDPRITPPTGVGSLPADNAEVRFLAARGYSLEQVERCSRLALPVPDATLRALLEQAGRAAGTDYRIVLWSGPTPPARQADVAELYTVMSIEEPSAGLDEPPDVWTVDRLVDAEQQDADGSRTRLVAAAEHLPSRRLVAFTVLSAPQEVTRPVAQEDTLVVPGHRGHRLGMLLKAANIGYLQRVHPGHPAIITFNAEENRHMLDVNDGVGFVPIGSEGAWKKTFGPVTEVVPEAEPGQDAAAISL